MDEEPEPEQAPRLVILTPAQKEYFLAKLSEARRALFRTARDVNSFNRATTWALKIFSFDVVADAVFFPDVSFGASFADLTGYVSRRIMDADAEDIVEADETNL